MSFLYQFFFALCSTTSYITRHLLPFLPSLPNLLDPLLLLHLPLLLRLLCLYSQHFSSIAGLQARAQMLLAQALLADATSADLKAHPDGSALHCFCMAPTASQAHLRQQEHFSYDAATFLPRLTPLTHSLASSLTHSLIHSFTSSLTHPPTHLLACLLALTTWSMS